MEAKPGTLIIETRGAVLAVTGELDAATSPQLHTALGQHAPGVLDVSGVTYIDSSGLRALIIANDTLRDGGRQLTLCGVTGTTRRLLEVTDTAGLFTIT
jgi:anti-sigma B factor antagonist